MSEVQAAAREQQRVEELCVAAIRALSGQRDLHFRGRRLHRGRQRLPLFAPHLHPQLERDDFDSFRGAADGLGLRLRFSDAALHATLCPPEPIRRLVFELLEQYRCEALAPAAWPGVQRNLAHRFERWTAGFHDAGLADSARGILLFTVAQIARARVTGQPVPEAVEDLLEATRAGIAPVLGPGLALLRRTRHDQAAYAHAALQIADAVAALLEDAGAEAQPDPDGSRPESDERTAFGFLLDLDDAAEAEAVASVVTGRSRVLEGSDDGYRIFTTAYDRELRPAARLRREELDEYRQRLDGRIAAQNLNLPRLARQLQALLARPRRDDWADAQEEGLVDGRRLAQLIASPTERRLFRQEQREPRADAVVGFLIDCSGSMRQHVEPIAMLVDVLARALEMAEVPCEILGFSTGAWNGGRALRDWQHAGRPAHPGRLNEIAHLIFKDAATPWRRARRDIAALLRPDQFREGVDGEALTWAATRLRTRSEPRKLLIAVSDGCPMDGATQSANDAHYLDHHLQQVAAGIETAGDIELAAIGVGLDLSPYYGRCRAVDLDQGLGPALWQDLVALVGSHGRR
ncbi:MAG: cobalt chelatase [Rubrivivax sp.]